MIVVRRQSQQDIVAKTRGWRDMTDDGIGYDFEHTRRAVAVQFGFSTANTGYWNTGEHVVVGRFSTNNLLQALRRLGLAVLIPFLAFTPRDS